MNILLGVHPSVRQAFISKADRRGLWSCPKCHEEDGTVYQIVEPANYVPGTEVMCDRCGSEAPPTIVPNIPSQHGIWIGGKEGKDDKKVDPENKASLIAAGYRHVGYCERRTSPAMMVEDVDEPIMARIKALIEKTYGGKIKVFPRPLNPDELEAKQREEAKGDEEDDEEIIDEEE